MTTPKTIGNYGGPYSDARAKENPEVELGADEGNRLLEDVAQLTRPALKAFVTFTASTAAPGAIVPTAWRTQWGSGVSQKPTVDKTATGLYTITWATTYDDALGVTETLGFVAAYPYAYTSVATENVKAKLLTLSANACTLALWDLDGAALDDNITEDFKVQVEFK